MFIVLRLYILYYAIRCQHLTGHDRIHWNSSKYAEHSYSQTRRDIVNSVPSGQKFLCSYLDCKQATCQKLFIYCSLSMHKIRRQLQSSDTTEMGSNQWIWMGSRSIKKVNRTQVCKQA